MATKKSVKPVPEFKVGEEVVWESQAGGSFKAKCGRIAFVVPAGREGGDQVRKFIKGKVHDGTHRSTFGGGWERPEISYVVEVDGPSPKAKKVLYWPHAKSLTKSSKNKGKSTGLPA